MNSSLKNLIYPSYNKNNDYIELDLYISSHCNYRCSYCFVHDYSIKFNEYNFNKQIEFLAAQKYKIKCDILGGEPSIIKNLCKYVNEYSKYCEKISVFSNGSNTRELNDIPCDLIITPHFEYYNKTYESKLLELLKYRDVNKLKTFLNIVVNKSNYEKIIPIVNVFRDFANVAITADINESRDEVNDLSYFRKFNLEPQESYYDGLMLNEKKLSFEDLDKLFFSRGLRCKMWICYLNYFQIQANGDVLDQCYNKFYGNIYNSNVILTPIKHICRKNNCSECTIVCPKIIPASLMKTL